MVASRLRELHHPFFQCFTFGAPVAFQDGGASGVSRKRKENENDTGYRDPDVRFGLRAVSQLAGRRSGAPGNYPPAGGYGVPPNGYPAQGQDPYSVGAGVGAPGAYPPAGGYGVPQGAYPAQAVCGPGYIWINGYTDANGYFVDGYCAVPPFAGAYWIAPGYYGGRFVGGYWGRGGYGYGYGVRGGYGGNYGIRGGYGAGARVGGGYSSGFRAPAASARSFQSQGGYRGGGSAMRSGGSAMRSGGSSHGGGSSRSGGSGHGGRR